MSFNSLTFAILLASVLALYWRLTRRGQNILLLAASYLFYGWWDWRFLSLLVYSSLLDYWVALRIDGAPSQSVKRRWLAVSLVGNLALLGGFKYCHFFVHSAAFLIQQLGFHSHEMTLRIILPVGISFYTFQTMSYVIDTYRGHLKPTRDWPAYLAYVSFFPQLVAGPIERGTTFLPQFLGERRFDHEAARDGIKQCLWGLFKKIAIADYLALFVDGTYADPARASGWQLLLATYCFAFVIYGDFSGYSDMALGMARLFGFRLMRNFSYPYFSTSLREFWQRWHISLSTWFRDYVYIPLGGNRCSTWITRRNVMITCVASGLWHGANWTFVIWGAMHGFALVVESVLERAWNRVRLIPDRVKRLLGAWMVFHVVLFGWVFFRAASVGDAWSILRKIMAIRDLPHGEWIWLSYLAGMAGLVAVEWSSRHRQHPLEDLRLPAAGRLALYGWLVAVMVAVSPTTHVPFIYFQF